MWERVVLVAVGGALGAVSRYGLQGLVAEWRGPTVLGTFAVNISGTLLLGLFLGLTEERWTAPYLARTAVAIGFLGAYTTFSTLMFESVDLAESGSFATAVLNIGGSLLVGLSALYAGLAIGRSI